MQVRRGQVLVHKDVLDQDQLPVDDVPKWLGQQAGSGEGAGGEDHERRLQSDPLPGPDWSGREDPRDEGEVGRAAPVGPRPLA